MQHFWHYKYINPYPYRTDKVEVYETDAYEIGLYYREHYWIKIKSKRGSPNPGELNMGFDEITDLRRALHAIERRIRSDEAQTPRR